MKPLHLSDAFSIPRVARARDAAGIWRRCDLRLLPVRLTHGPLAGRLWWLHLDGSLDARIVAGRKQYRFTPISDAEWWERQASGF